MGARPLEAVLEACGPGAIPGDPEGLREAAHSLDESAALAESSLEDIRRASTTVLAGWAAPSAQGYEGLTQEQLACIRGMIAARRGAAKVLRECADELEAAQRAFAGAVEDERSAERSLDSAERGSREEHRAEADIDDARAEKAAAGRAALAANEHAARVIRALREGLAKVPPTPSVPAPGTGLDGGSADTWSWGDLGHGILDVAGLVPVFGEPADGLNGIWYAAEGDELNAGLSFAGMVPGLGWGATATKWGIKGAKAAKGARAAGEAADEAAAFRGIASSGTRKLTGETEAYLGVTKPPGSVTHHLVPKGKYVNRRAKEQLHRAQATLRRHGIGPDDGPNGAFLDPKAHGPIHTNEYFRELNRRLSRAQNPQRAREILDRIREEVQNGRFPH